MAEVGTAVVGTWAGHHMAAAFHIAAGRDTFVVDSLDWHILPDKAAAGSPSVGPRNDLYLLVAHLPMYGKNKTTKVSEIR